ncbi:ABC transporter ATP-binding protein [Gordoniibacillus kamchatkensis]|uniref:ABC transporter ATP-binding protein n=1 Tax=Gordoniibacillus kamchatkensis TaxID=1590651 RepID=A0ABR5AE37_9BACL|nr:ABC transporter ATP-binding protein [Paenibacillus sp. VKM B-2647]KIL39314.1 ABC transporter ATP-binding protein [Paenibacillus sp. VKM B-2647]
MNLLHVRIEEAGYEAHSPAIRDIEFGLRQGELVGLIGHNGAGKSTTIKAMLGMIRHMRGSMQWAGERPSYAYVPEHPVVYDDLTLWEHLETAAAVYELERPMFIRRAEELLRQFRMEDVRHHLPGSFSKGMRQKLMLILAFLHQPDVYIVDEPFVGLDPRGTKQFLELLRAERERGAGVLMSTHVLDAAERMCDRFVLIADGTLAAQGTLDDLRAASGLPDGTLFDCFHELA